VIKFVSTTSLFDVYAGCVGILFGRAVQGKKEGSVGAFKAFPRVAMTLIAIPIK
jgi:hypothetical protein